jgi:hypothetical protein
MKKIIMLAMVMVFLWTGVSFAENWIVYNNIGDRMIYSFDADRVLARGNGYDYWRRLEFSPPLSGIRYVIEHYQLELRNDTVRGDRWWMRVLESWDIDSQGATCNYGRNVRDWWFTADSFVKMNIEFLDGLRKYAR